ncbi:MAG TPA: hydroxymethylbilane synthase, partial [Stellaceae bacterium]|nr:hydroxymethylbilane synthase [Stellaceae bacterium]
MGTRGSALALAQAAEVRARLARAHAALQAPDAIETVAIRTSGDAIGGRPLADLGGKGLFAKEIEEALLDGRIDLAVHSLKDLPTFLPDGLAIAGHLPREDARDGWFSPRAPRIAALPEGATIGTSSPRRSAQLLHLRPDLRILPLRGNVETRLRKVEAGEVDGTLLAMAGLKRLGLEGRITAVLAPEEMLPAAAQGAIGIEIRAADERVRALVAAIDDAPTAARIAAERAVLAVLGGSCHTPIAALAEIDAGASLRLRAMII